MTAAAVVIFRFVRHSVRPMLEGVGTRPSIPDAPLPPRLVRAADFRAGPGGIYQAHVIRQAAQSGRDVCPRPIRVGACEFTIIAPPSVGLFPFRE